MSELLHCEKNFSVCEHALTALQTDSPPDIFLLDIGLQGMSGIEGITSIRSLSPATQVIILTGTDDDDKIFEALCNGAFGYLLKSSKMERLLEEIEGAVNGGAPLSPQIARRVMEMFSHRDDPKSNYDLTIRETEILQCMVQGLSKKQIAEKLIVSAHTVDSHQRNIYLKLQAHSLAQVVAKAVSEKLVIIDQ